MGEKIISNLEDTVRTEVNSGERTIEDLLSATEIEQLIHDTTNKSTNEKVPAFIRQISNQSELAHKLATFRLNRGFKVPRIEAEGYSPFSDESARAYELWDEQEARKLLQRYPPSLEDTVNTTAYQPLTEQASLEAMKEIRPEAKIETEVERLQRLFDKVSARGNEEDIAYFADKLAAAKKREHNKNNTLAPNKTIDTTRADLLEMMTVMGAKKEIPEIKLDGRSSEDSLKEVIETASVLPPEPAPQKLSLFGRFKKWLNTDDSKKEIASPEPVFNEEVPPPPPNLRRIENPARVGLNLEDTLAEE